MPKALIAMATFLACWLVSQMDWQRDPSGQVAKSRVVTVAIEGMSFLNPVRVGDTVACYAWIEKIGRTSMKICVDVWVTRFGRASAVKSQTASLPTSRSDRMESRRR